VRLERLDEDLALSPGEMVATHWADEPVTEASASRSSDAAPESSIIASGMEDVVHASAGEPYSSF
jgi:hypothetical protein